MNREECPICRELLVSPIGPTDAPLILIGAYPGWEEIRSGTPWIGNAGEVLKGELARAGINYGNCRVTNLWLHAEVDNKEPHYAREVDYHMGRLIHELANKKRLIHELANKKGALIMGRQPVERLIGRAISDVESLNVQGDYLPSSLEVCIVSKNPAICLTDGAVVGNVRHAIERFAEMTKEWR
jgi:uracil-DNA glycosylase family 4